MIDIAVSFIEIKIRNDYMRTSMSNDVKLSLYDYATTTPLRGYTDQRRCRNSDISKPHTFKWGPLAD